jgi:type IV secretion system protein VirB10
MKRNPFLPLVMMCGIGLSVVSALAQDRAAGQDANSAASDTSAKSATSGKAAAADDANATLAKLKNYLLETGTHIPLALINSVSTKNAVAGDRVYLETVFPIMSGGRIVIPPGSYVMGTITSIKRPGRVKGLGEFHLRFESLTLPNGTTRDFRAHLTNLDGRASESLDRNEGTIRSDSNKGGDARVIAETAAAGAGIGGLAGAATKAPGMGAAIGAGAGATAALIGILVSRGPDAILAKGTTVEMVLDREVGFDETELDFSAGLPRKSYSSDSNGPMPKGGSSGPGIGYPGRIPRF